MLGSKSLHLYFSIGPIMFAADCEPLPTQTGTAFAADGNPQQCSAGNGLIEALAATEKGGNDHDILRMYLSEISHYPLPSAEQEIDLGRSVREGDHEAWQIMVESNLRLVVHIARRYPHRHLPFLDLIRDNHCFYRHAVPRRTYYLVQLMSRLQKLLGI